MTSQQLQHVQQVIDGRYVDRASLMNLLRKTFGEGSFEVRVGGIPGRTGTAANEPQLQLNRWILSLPRRLTEVSPP